ncbi:hypothetical protein INT47_002011 [Mucor saturninus]|uniref:Uncharacterized protein n=1 Tax=Mucor saturninus TaxID=64648 RepID=A0A8H7R244_9FUNG|nr:hypothetical protein INT47_002011 [Mucor saturninus]
MGVIILDAGKLMRGALILTYDSYSNPIPLLADNQIAVPQPSTNPSCHKTTAEEMTSAVDKFVFEGHATKQAVMELLKSIASTTERNEDIYEKIENISNNSIRDKVARFIPSVADISMTTFSQMTWNLTFFNKDQVVVNLFNKHSYIDSVISGECTTIGYARKSLSNEFKSVRLRLLESMTSILVDPCRCSKIFVTPLCNANSPLLERDLKRSPLTKDVRHAYGDMHDLISYVKTSMRPIRLVVIDYAGLTTSPQDLYNFIS